MGEAAVWLSDHVVDALCLYRILGVGQAHKAALIQTLIPLPPVEALSERVVHELSLVDEVENDAVHMRPLVQHLAGELRIIVAADRRQQAARSYQALQRADDAFTRQLEVDLDHRALSREVGDQRQRANPPIVTKASFTKFMLQRSLPRVGSGDVRDTATRFRCGGAPRALLRSSRYTSLR